MSLGIEIKTINEVIKLFFVSGWWILFLSSVGAQLSPLLSTSGFSQLQLRDGSSYVILTDRLVLTPGTLIGFSFRTCLPSGQLFRQIGQSNDLLSLSFSEAGGLRLSLESGEERRTLVAGANLADGAWHTVRLGVSANQTAICLGVDGPVEWECGSTPESAPSSVSRLEDAASLLTSLQLAGASSQLRVGSGLVGCLSQGPQLRFSAANIADSAAVDWSTCAFPESCTGQLIENVR